jgi:hypothetical protein
VRGWFDRYLRSDPDGTQPGQVQITTNNQIETYGSWAAQNGGDRRYGLGAIRRLDGTGLLGGSTTTGWSKTVPTDLDTVADGGVVLLTNGVAAFTGLRPTIWLPAVDRARAGVWASARPSSAVQIRGIPRLPLNLTGTAATGALVAYLYDLVHLGGATLITHAPTTWISGSAGSRTVDLDLTATAYDVPAGHSLTLVVDTVDPLYYDANASGRTIAITGGSSLDIPLK